MVNAGSVLAVNQSEKRLSQSKGGESALQRRGIPYRLKPRYFDWRPFPDLELIFSQRIFMHFARNDPRPVWFREQKNASHLSEWQVVGIAKTGRR